MTCRVCGGSKDSHFDDKGKPITQHAYTERAGDLVTHEEMAKRQSPPPRTPVVFGPGGNPTITDRLVEVMLKRELITSEEALYIAGFSPSLVPEGGQHGNGA